MIKALCQKNSEKFAISFLKGFCHEMNIFECLINRISIVLFVWSLMALITFECLFMEKIKYEIFFYFSVKHKLWKFFLKSSAFSAFTVDSCQWLKTIRKPMILKNSAESRLWSGKFCWKICISTRNFSCRQVYGRALAKITNVRRRIFQN